MVAREAHLAAKIATPKNSIPRYIRFQALRGARGWYSDCVGGVWKLRERVWCVCVYDHAFPRRCERNWKEWHVMVFIHDIQNSAFVMVFGTG